MRGIAFGWLANNVAIEQQYSRQTLNFNEGYAMVDDDKMKS